MSQMVVVSETSKITSLKLGMWLFYLPLLGSSHFEFVHSLDKEYAKLSNGLTINTDGQVVDPEKNYSVVESEDMWSTVYQEVTLHEISIEEFEKREKLEADFQRRFI